MSTTSTVKSYGDWTSDEIIAALQRVARGSRFLSISQYRGRKSDDEPHVAYILFEFKSWSRALTAAGLLNRTKRRSEQEKLARTAKPPQVRFAPKPAKKRRKRPDFPTQIRQAVLAAAPKTAGAQKPESSYLPIFEDGPSFDARLIHRIRQATAICGRRTFSVLEFRTILPFVEFDDSRVVSRFGSWAQALRVAEADGARCQRLRARDHRRAMVITTSAAQPDIGHRSTSDRRRAAPIATGQINQQELERALDTWLTRHGAGGLEQLRQDRKLSRRTLSARLLREYGIRLDEDALRHIEAGNRLASDIERAAILAELGVYDAFWPAWWQPRQAAPPPS